MSNKVCLIPCFNESGNLLSLCEEIKSLNYNNIDWYLINNGSTDIDNISFQRIIENNKDQHCIKTFFISKNKGYGYGLKKCIVNILDQYEEIIWTHADGQTPLNDVIKALEISSQNKKIEIIKGIRVSRKDGIIASTFTFFLNICLFFSGNYNYRSPNSQPTLIKKYLLEKIILKTEDNGNFDVSALIKSKRFQNRIIRFPVNFNNRKKGEGSNEKFFDKIKYSFSMLRYIFFN